MKKELVEVRPLPRKKWHGKAGKQDFSQPISIRALYDVNTGGYATGLTEEETILYSKKTGLDLSSTFNPDKAHPVWDNQVGKIKLPPYPIFLDPEKDMDFVKIKVLKASSQVENSLSDHEKGVNPDATHVIYDEVEQIEVKATKAQKRKECYLLSNELSDDQLSNVLTVISEKPITGRSKAFLTVELENVIENKPTEFLMYARMDKNESYIRASLFQALHRNILTKEGNAIYYMNDRIADNFEDAVKYFKDTQNQKLKASLLDKLA